MKAVIQRVTSAKVEISNQTHSQINHGALILIGIESSDSNEDIEWLSKKISNMRIFDDSDGIMNLSINDISAQALVVSQFTLHASTKKGNRPSYTKAARPEISEPLYHHFIKSINSHLKNPCQTGKFGADMQVSLINDGPVTIIIDSKNKE